MQMIPVSSSNIDSIGYDGDTLYVRFNSGGLYSYAHVPERVYRQLMSALSHGKYFAAHIKNVYPYRRLN